MKYPKGSEWRKWDLHIHTPKSIVQNYGGDSEDAWDRFVQSIANLPPEIKVIGITDYLFIDGYEHLLTRRSEIPNIDLIIPNIEFRLNTFSGTASNTKRHNFHVLFDPQVSISDIKEQLLNCLSKGYLIQDKSTWERTPTVNSLQELGRKIKSAAPTGHSIHSKTDLQVGFENITYDRNEILKNLEKDCFKEKCLTCIGYSEWDQCRWDQSAAEKRDLINKADFALTCSDDPAKIAENYQELKANNLHKLVLHSSDAHSFDRIGKTLLWIKSDPTFEGLRQLLYEPEERVSIQTDCPMPPRSNLTIGKIKITESKINDELSIAGTEIELNSGLVAVAGGKGTGKTAFVDQIANCYFDRVNSDDENSFVRRIADQNPNLKIELTFRDKSIFSKKATDQLFFEEGQIAYIAQGELEQYIGERSDLDEYHPYIRLLYTQTDDEAEKKIFDYKVLLHRTPCNYGGYRYWFLCPLARNGMMCGNRSGVLYKAGDYFGCRHCYNLTYWCRKHNTSYKLNYWFRSRKALNKMMALEAEIKRADYGGKITKKRKRLHKIYNKTIKDLSKFDLPT